MLKKLWKKVLYRCRQIFGRCPYCGEKLKSGMGGGSILFLSGLRFCPHKHYAEETHPTGAVIVYDDGGKTLPIKDYTEER
jgi:hypothetical protein